MKLTEEETALFQQLGQSPAWRQYLEKRLADRINVLKVNKTPEQLYTAQGAVAELELLQSATARIK
jgi:hypothetical protein